MTTLGDINNVKHKITNEKAKSVKALHTFIFGNEHLHLNRSNLKKFSGFPFDENSEEFAKKIEEVKSKLRLADFVSICHILNINYAGTENEIIKRILSYLCHVGEENNEADEEEEEEDEVNNENEESNTDEVTEVNEIKKKMEKINLKTVSFTISFSDIEDSIKRFDGKDGYSIKKWIQDFEDIAELLQWEDFHKLIFAKKFLDGFAKLLVQSEKDITSWVKLKALLIKEFEVQDDSAKVYKLLMTRKKKKEETLQEYVLVMREIGSRVFIEPEVIIQYIIDGIPDEINHKMILHGAKTFEEFKEKIKLYNTVKMKTSSKDLKKTASVADNFQDGR